MLEGRLDDLSLPDLFQLLALTHKTGTLRVRYGDTAGAVIFREGQIVGAFDDVRRTAPGTRMLAAGLIDDAQLEAALDASEHTGEGGTIGALVAHGAIDEPSVAEFRRQQAEDAVFALMRLSDATFSLETGEVAPLAGEVQLNTEQLVVEGGRRLSEWAEIRRRVPGRQSVPSLVADPPGEGPVTVGREQWRLLALVDGRRTVGDLVDLLGSGEYATSAELSGLVDAGLLTVGDRATHAVGVRSRGDRLRELEARELGLLRDDPGQTPETDTSAAPAAETDAGDAADGAEPPAAEDDTSDTDDAETDDAEVETDEPDTGDADTGEPPTRTARPTARRSRSTLAPTLISGIELGDDPETSGQPIPPVEDDSAPAEPAGDHPASADSADAALPGASEPDTPDVAAQALGAAEERESSADEVDDEDDEDDEAHEPDSSTPTGPAPLPAAPPHSAASTAAAARTERNGTATPPDAAEPADDESSSPQPSLGTGLPAAPDKPAAEPGNRDPVGGDDEPEAEQAAEPRMTRDEDINKAMLLRLIDGVKGV